MKLIKNKTLVLLLLFYACFITAQNPQEFKPPCYTDEHRANIQNLIPSAETIEEFERWLAPLVKEYKEGNRSSETCQNPIKLIFHIINDGEPINTGDNIPASLINAQIEQLNIDFSMAGISFVAADKNEEDEWLSEPGINRIDRNDMGWLPPPYGDNTCFSPHDEDPQEEGEGLIYVHNTMQPQSQWAPERFLNIWVLDIYCSIYAIAQPPLSSLPGLEDEGDLIESDGILIDPDVIGSLSNPNPVNSPNGWNAGKTLTHELGHFFGLLHIWGPNSCQADCCDVDDFCEDTPNTAAANQQCPVGQQGCDSPAAIDNFMDYTNDICRTTFTPDQIARMMVVLENSPRRGSLCCESALTIDFHFENEEGEEKTSFCYGAEVFIDGSTSGYATHYYLEPKRRPIGSTAGWEYLTAEIVEISGPYLNFRDWLTAQGQNLISGYEYSVKLAAQNDCNSWSETIEEFEVHTNEVIAEYYFEDDDQNLREIFCSFETVFLNGTVSEGEIRYWLEVGHAPIGTQDFTPLASGWTQGQVNTINFNQWMILKGFPLEQGFIYRAKLGVQNDCDPWDEVTHQFIFNDCCAPPTNLTCTNINGNNFLTWTNNDPDATGFFIYIDPTSDCCENLDDTSPSGIFVPVNQFSLKNIGHQCFEWQVITVCDDGSFSPLSATACFNSSSSCFGFSPFADTNHDDVNKNRNLFQLKPVISPNPSNGQILIEFQVNEPTFVKIQMYNLDGQLIKRFEQENVPPGFFKKEWDADSGLPNGIYLIHIQTNTGSTQEKLVILKS